MKSSDAAPSDQIVVYEAPDGQVQVDVHLDRETVWLSQEQMAELFGRERSVVTKHIRNVFKEGELEPEAVRAKFAHTAADGKTYQVDHFNLDVIISVGYRVKSLRGTQFRTWATRTLREHLLRGYTPSRSPAVVTGRSGGIRWRSPGRDPGSDRGRSGLPCTAF